MKVKVLKRIWIGHKFYEPSPEILNMWSSEARKGILSGHLEDIEGNFLAALTAKDTYKKRIETRKKKG